MHLEVERMSFSIILVQQDAEIQHYKYRDFQQSELLAWAYVKVLKI